MFFHIFLLHFNIKYFANFVEFVELLEIIFKYVKVNYNLMTEILLLFKHAYNFVFVFVRNFKQFIFGNCILIFVFTVTMR